MLNYSVIITAGGTGKRMGTEIPKQFIEIAGKPLLFHTISIFHRHNPDSQILLTLPADWMNYWDELISTYQFDVEHQVIAGGEERFHSIQNAIQHCQESIVMVHDGVRPLVSIDTLNRCIVAMKEHNAVIPVLSLKDSIRKVDGTKSESRIRSEYRIVQTPQCFDIQLLDRAYKQTYDEGLTDDASTVEKLGVSIFCVDGNDENIKVTTPMDLLLAKALLK